MPVYNIGKTIREYRTRKKISQEDLCYNICSVSSYSRIERGEQIPEKKTIEAITSRLGITIMYYNDLGCSF